MPCTGQSLTSPSISCLDYLVSWDISGAQPIVTVTNNSTVTDYTKLSWWFYITTPSGVSIHGVDLASLSSYPTADIAGITWTTRSFNIPTPFGNPPCGQVEWSPTTPYVVEVFVTDSAATSPYPLNSYSKNAIIVRPGGNTKDTCGNFGVAQVSVQVDCQNKNIMCFDSTNLTYNNILATAPDSNTWTLVYPQDPSGNIPNKTATNTPSVNFPVSVNSDGYTLYLQEYVTYNYGNGVTVKVQYKLFSNDGSLGNTFAVACNTNLCLLQCQMQAFYEESKATCGTIEDANLQNTMIKLNFLYSQILTAIFQPLCGIDIASLMAEMKRIGKFSDNCGCGCGDNTSNFGFSNPTGSSTSACCPVYVNVIDKGTGLPVANCAAGYFPATVYDPTNTTIIGVATSMPNEINIINSNAAWQAYGTAFDTGNCRVGFFSLNSGTIIPNINVVPASTSTACTPAGTQTYSITISNTCGTSAITSASYPYVASVNFGAGAVSLGSVTSDAALISALNATSTKPAAVTFNLGSTSGVLNIVINNTNCTAFNTPIIVTGCRATTSVANLAIFDRNTLHAPVNCPLSFYPTIVWSIDNAIPLGVASSADDLISILNSNAGWTAIGTFSNAGNCSVTVNLTTTISPSLFVPVSVPTGGGSGCVSNTQVYQINLVDYCQGTPVSTLAYPFFGFVNYGTGVIPLGNIVNLGNLISLLNSNSAKPGPLTFSSGTSATQIQVNVLNTNCTTYNTPTTVYADTGSGKQYIAMGGNHHNFAATGGSLDFFGVTGNVAIGKQCNYPISSAERPFHTVKVGNFTYTTEGSTGKIYVCYVGSPLTPSVPSVIQLNTVVTGANANFSGNPATYGEQSYYGLYFPTNFISVGYTLLYVVESISGTIWEIDTTTNTVTRSFQDNRLLGKCPRVLVNRGVSNVMLYFTQDGHIEQDASLSSGVAEGSIITLECTAFNSGAISAHAILGSEYIVAMDFDGTNTFYMTGDAGSIFTTSLALTPIGVNSHRWVISLPMRWSNLKLANGRLYLSNYSTGTRWLNLTDIGGSVPPTAFAALNPTLGSANNLLHYNFVPVPSSCFGILTYYQPGSSTTTNHAGLAKYTNDGIFVSLIDVPVGDIYNVIFCDFVTATPTVYTPNTLCPLP